MEKLKTLFNSILGILFLVSGILKLYPIEMLELDLGYHTGMPEWLAMIFARLLIGFELVLGFLLLIRFRERQLIKLAATVLVFFSCYLIYLMIQFPEQDNCGCMGMLAPMTPSQSLMKNAGMLGVVVILLVLKQGVHPALFSRFHRIVPVIVLVGFLLPFVINTIDWTKNELRLTINLTHQQQVLEGMKIDTGSEVLVAYVSPHCIYCKMLARKWVWFLARNQWKTPIHLVFMGENIDSDIQEFLNQTGIVPASYVSMNTFEFIEKTNGSLPSIYLVQNGKVVQKDNFISLNESNLKSLIR